MHGCMTEYVFCNHPRADGRIAVSVARCVCNTVAWCVYISVARCVFITVARCVCIKKWSVIYMHELLPHSTIIYVMQCIARDSSLPPFFTG